MYPRRVLQVQQRAKEWKGTQVKYGSGLFRIHGQHCEEISSHYPAVPALTRETACPSVETISHILSVIRVETISHILSVMMHKLVSGKRIRAPLNMMQP